MTDRKEQCFEYTLIGYYFVTGILPFQHPFNLLNTMRGKPRRGMLRRAVFSDAQRKGLEKMFQKQKYISKPDRKKLAEKLNLKDSQVRKSFKTRCQMAQSIIIFHQR